MKTTPLSGTIMMIKRAPLIFCNSSFTCATAAAATPPPRRRHTTRRRAFNDISPNNRLGYASGLLRSEAQRNEEAHINAANEDAQRSARS